MTLNVCVEAFSNIKTERDATSISDMSQFIWLLAKKSQPHVCWEARKIFIKLKSTLQLDMLYLKPPSQTSFRCVKSAVCMPEVNIDLSARLKCHKTGCKDRSLSSVWLGIQLETESANSLLLTALVGWHLRTLHKRRKMLGCWGCRAFLHLVKASIK